MKVRKNLLTRTILIIPLLTILASSFCFCLVPASAMMMGGMPCGELEKDVRLMEDLGAPTCVKAAKISAEDLTVPPKVVLASKLLPQAFTTQVASVNFDPHLLFTPIFSSASHPNDPSVEIFTLNATYRL